MELTPRTFLIWQGELTPRGLASPDEVVACVLGYLGFLAREPPQEWVHAEMRDISALRFRFAEEEPPIEYTRKLALLMVGRDETSEMRPPR